MPILRKNHSNGFTQISNDLLRNKDISLKAKGLLCYMLSCDDGWKFSIKGIAANCKECASSITSTLNELEALGYHKKEKIYEDGKIKEWVYCISEEPIYLDTSVDSATPVTDNTCTENQDLVNQHLVIQHDNNTIVNNTKERNKEISKDISADAELIPHKKNLYELCVDNINELFSDEEIKEALNNYLSVRITLGKMSAKSFRAIIIKLNDLADTKEEALQIVYTATVRGYMSFYKDTGKQEHYKKPVVMGNDDGILINRRKT